MRHLAIGDIHGCLSALETLAELVGFAPDDTVITLGDHVNRGPSSSGVLDWLIEFEKTHTLIALRGNHDIMMLEARHDRHALRRWLRCGGKETLKSYSRRAGFTIDEIPDRHWEFLEQKLRASYEMETHFFVHANAYPDIPIGEQPDYMLYWEKLGNPRRHESGKIMVCGHTSQKGGKPWCNGNAICIDTWACGGKWLTCLHVETGVLWQAKENGKTRTMLPDEYLPGAGCTSEYQQHEN